MSSTIRQAILSLKSRIADAYTAIAAKGGTMPATQDSSSLPTAIESIPGKGDYDIISGIRLSDDPSDPSVPTRPLPDGLSLMQLLCSTFASSVTEIVDDNTGWTMTNSVSFKYYFPNSNKVQLGCGDIQVPFEHAGGVVFGSDEEYKFTALKKITPATSVGFGHGIFKGDVQSHDIDLGDAEEIAFGGFFGLIRSYGSITDYRYALIARKVRKCSYLFSLYNDSQIGITKVVLGKIETNNFQPYYVYGRTLRTPNLIHWEFGQDTAVSLNLRYWNPTNALDASRTDLIEEGSTASNNLQQFILNFREFIALRLANRTGTTALTLTLSAAVYGALTSDTRSLADLGITAAGITTAETAAGITTATAYNSWLDTYRTAINWNYAQA